MALSDRFKSQNRLDNRIFMILAFVICFFIFVLLGRVFYPQYFNIIVDIIWLVFLTVTVIFIGLGVLVAFGMRKEVTRLLDLLFEGSMTFFDFLAFLRRMFRLFVQKLINFLLFIAPILSYVFAFVVLFLLLLLYKFVGRSYDVTGLTVVLSVLLVAIIGIFNLPKDLQKSITTWQQIFRKRIVDTFSDAFEVVVFIFFLIMDSSNLFFLPDSLNVPLHAEVFGYDLMPRGIAVINERATITLVILAITIEITRNILRLIVVALKYNKQQAVGATVEFSDDREYGLKGALRYSFNQSKDEIIKFITYTTLLLIVFLFFPRLKLVALVFASATSFLLDLVFPQRMGVKRGEDLISRLIFRVVKV